MQRIFSKSPSICSIVAILLSLPVSHATTLTDPNNPAEPIIDSIAPKFVIGNEQPEPFIGIVNPIYFDATFPIIKPSLGEEIDKIVISDQAESTNDIPTKLTFAPSGEIGPLSPGQYTITWTATDPGFNETSLIQTVNIRPSINLSLDQVVGEGAVATVTAHLSGKAPSYPLAIPYRVVADTADSDDHNASDGEFVFTENQTSASIDISIIDDGPGDEGEKFSIILNLESASQVFSKDQKNSHTIIISETNLTPHAHLHANQNDQVTRIITNDAGKVTICAMPDCGEAHDANGDNIKYDWSATDNALVPVAGTTNQTFEFETQDLSPGFYTIRLTVSDTFGNASTHDLLLRLLETGIKLTDTDSDDDKINDDIEGHYDNDNDGIPNYLDAIEHNSSLIQAYEPYLFDPNLKTEDSYSIDSIKLSWELSSSASNLTVYPLLIATNPGLHINIGPTAFAAQKTYARLETISAENLRGTSLPEGVVSSDGQVIDIEITNIGQTGKSVLVVLPQAAPIPSSQDDIDPRFILFSKDKTWQDFINDDDNKILTTNKSNSYCPDLSHTASYTNSLTKGDECLLIKIQDGGPNDYDGFANGSIRLMGAVFITTDGTANDTQSNGGIFTGSTDSTQEGTNRLDLGTGNGGGSLGFISLLMLLAASLRYSTYKLNKSAHHKNAA